MIYVTADLHGVDLDSFTSFLSASGFGPEDRLYVLGDVIDGNGGGGVALLRWMIRQDNITLLKGNHEVLMTDSLPILRGQVRSYDNTPESNAASVGLAAWIFKGGDPELHALAALKEEDPAEHARILDYVEAAPLYAEVGAGGRNFILVHSGLGGFHPSRKLSNYHVWELTKSRPDPDKRYFEDRLVIFGHTPGEDYGEAEPHMHVTDTWIDIDTNGHGAGKPMLLRLEDLQAFYMG